MKKQLAVLFPGIGYHADKPLLYYSAKLARAHGCEVTTVQYPALSSGLRGNPEQIEAAVLHGLHPGQVYFTPIEAALPDLDPAGIAFHGTADPWARTELITEGCRRLGVPLHLTENADHSMETGDVLRDITILHTILEQTDRWMRQRCI